MYSYISKNIKRLTCQIFFITFLLVSCVTRPAMEALKTRILAHLEKGETEQIIQALENRGMVREIIGAPILFSDPVLHIAILHNNLPLARFFLDNGAAVDDRNNEGYTALHLALLQNHSLLIKFLLSERASIHVRDFSGWTPLYCAIHSNNYNVTQFFLESGADLDISDNEERGPLHIALQRGNSVIANLIAQERFDRGKFQQQFSSELVALVYPNFVRSERGERGLAVLVAEYAQPSLSLCGKFLGDKKKAARLS